MNTKVKKFGAVVVSGATLLFTVSPVFAADLTISGNGKDSWNTIVYSDECKSSVKQSNAMYVGNYVQSSANTGGNNVSGNTGGTNDVDTGKATSTALIMVMGGGNSADAPDCCDCVGDTSAEIKNNGKDSKNTIVATSSNKTRVKQRNEVTVRNRVESKAKTGKNRVRNNTGGDNSVITGESESSVGIVVSAGSNTLE